ncbi:MAG: response regulator, partial [Actinomycetota bacterium]|nr:response regulator [Actinomycetota bacterium]
MARILVVDDSPEMRHLLTSILVEEGHKVVVAPDGQKALDMVVADPPDIMVLDIMMPAMDGYMVLKELRATGIRDTTKILILTAKTSEHDWVRGYK